MLRSTSSGSIWEGTYQVRTPLSLCLRTPPILEQPILSLEQRQELCTALRLLGRRRDAAPAMARALAVLLAFCVALATATAAAQPLLRMAHGRFVCSQPWWRGAQACAHSSQAFLLRRMHGCARLPAKAPRRNNSQPCHRLPAASKLAPLMPPP